MAINTAQKRMSAMNHGSPWRGPLVDATEASFTVGNRAAACWLYSGITVSSPAPLVPGIEFTFQWIKLQFTIPKHPLHFTLNEE